MTVWVVEIDLFETVGTLLQGRRNAHVVGFDNLECFHNIIHGKCNVVSARSHLCASIAPASLSCCGILLRGMNLNVSDLKPQPWKSKCRPRNLGHSQHVDIESAGGVEIRANDRDVIERQDSNPGWLQHAPIIA